MSEIVEWNGGLEYRSRWDETFLGLAFVIAQRSPDPSTVVGAVLVSKENRILSMGYNGPLRGSDNEAFPIERPEKYHHVIHAEQNALLQYYGNYQDIQDSTMYVTTRPCHVCLKEMLQKGIRRIVYTSVSANMITKEEIEIEDKMISDLGQKVEMIQYPVLDDIRFLLEKTINYINYKEKS